MTLIRALVLILLAAPAAVAQHLTSQETIPIANGAASGQPADARWLIEYDRTRQVGHNPPTVSRVKAYLSVRTVGDSLLGNIRFVPPPGATDTSTWAVRGVSRHNSWSLRVDPQRAGASGFSTALSVIMDYLRELIHGVAPTAMAFELTVSGDSIRGSRTIISPEGDPVGNPVVVTGSRVRQPRVTRRFKSHVAVLMTGPRSADVDSSRDAAQISALVGLVLRRPVSQGVRATLHVRA